jgi:hypothetical protein
MIALPQGVEPLWPGKKRLKVVGVTGPWSSGKTQFILSIAKQKRTRLYDLEFSSADCEDYEEEGLTRIDLPAEMELAYPGGYTAKDMFLWWLNDVLSLDPFQYDLIAVDPANELERGMTDWVKSRFAEWKFGSESSFAKMEGVFWGTVKDEWKRLLVKIATRCQTLGLSNHLKTVWKNGKPTEDLEPKGKKTFMELASLYLYLERDVLGTKEGRNLAQPPSAIVLKSRLRRTKFVDGMVDQIIPILPDRIPVATPKALREYLLNPVGEREIREDEMITEKTYSNEQVLELKARIAADELAAAQLNQGNIQEATALEREKKSAMQAAYASMTATEEAPQDEPEQEAPAVDTSVSIDAVRALMTLADKKGVKERVTKAIQNELGVDTTGVLTGGQAKSITREMLDKYAAGLDKVS